VRETLDKRPDAVKKPRFSLLARLKTGMELANVVGGSYAFIFEHDELDTEEDAKLVGGFLQTLQDWGDLWSELDSGQHVEARFSMTKEIKEAGFLIFGVCENRRMKSGDKVFDWPVAIVAVVRPTNAGITELGQLAVLLLNRPFSKRTNHSSPPLLTTSLVRARTSLLVIGQDLDTEDPTS